MKRGTPTFPLGALLRDPGNPDALDTHVVSSDEEYIVVSAGGDSRHYKRESMLLRRWLLPARTVVAILPSEQHQAQRTGIIINVCGEPEEGIPWTYLVQTELGSEGISEHQLRVLKLNFDDPVVRLELNGWRGPKRFFARLRLLQRTTVWKQDSEGIPALLGARIEPLFHQFYAARRCLLDRETRFLLADEVGLGKTIEAGLVIQALLATKPDLRVLIVTQGTNSRQWLSELYCRFGGRVFTHIDAVRYDSRENSRKELNDLFKTDLLIVTTSVLRTHSRALNLVASQHWDLLVVDEGHHLVNWPKLTASLRKISEGASGCLILTATPGRGDDQGLLEMLKVVAPNTYGDVAPSDFINRLEPQRTITEKLLYSEELIAALLTCGEIGEDDARELAAEWKGLFPNDQIVADRLAKMENGDGTAAEELVGHIQEHYRVDRRIIRTRRKTLSEYGSRYATRNLQVIEYEPHPAEVAVIEQIEDLLGRSDVPDTWKLFWSRHACTTPSIIRDLVMTRLGGLEFNKEIPISDPLTADLGPAEEEFALKAFLSSSQTFSNEITWLKHTLAQVKRWYEAEEYSPGRFCALCTWLDHSIRAGIKKIIVFSQSRPVIEELALYLRAAFGADAVAVMTHNLPDDRLAEVARRFERCPGCKVLCSDEIGAEGYNFQFSDAVVHLDQPSFVARVEQRIGRLDRIGRPEDRPVLSIAFIGPFELERAFLELNRDVFRVYERSIGGLEYLLPRFHQPIRAAAAEGTSSLRKLSAKMHPEIEAEEQRVDEAFSFFLDATRPELERAKKLADLVGDRSGDEDEGFIRDWCKELRIDLIPQERHCIKVVARVERLDAPLPILGARDWVKTGTFLRSMALDILGVQYFAPGHLLIDVLIQNAQDTHDARAAAFFRDLGVQNCGHVFCIVVKRLGTNHSAFPDSISPGLLRRAEHYFPAEWVRSVFEILPDGEISYVPHGMLFNLLIKDYQPTDRKCQPDHISQVVEHFPRLWFGVRDAVEVAKQVVLVQKKDEIEAAAAELEATLRSEMAYLRSRLNGSGSDDAGRALLEREALLNSVRTPLVVTDAVAIVVGSGDY